MSSAPKRSPGNAIGDAGDDAIAPAAGPAPADNSAKIKATLATYFLDSSLALYLLSANPIHLWRMYEIARWGGIPIPGEVLSYFDKTAKSLIADPGPSSPKAIAEAVGLGTGGGRSKAHQARTDQRNFDIVRRILSFQERATNGDAQFGLEDDLGIMQRVAEENGLSLDRVRAVYYEIMTRARRGIDSST